MPCLPRWAGATGTGAAATAVGEVAIRAKAEEVKASKEVVGKVDSSSKVGSNTSRVDGSSSRVALQWVAWGAWGAWGAES